MSLQRLSPMMLLPLLLSLTLTGCKDDSKADDTDEATTPEDTELTDLTDDTEATDDTGSTDDTDPGETGPLTVTVDVSDNPTLVLEKIISVTASSAAEVTLRCTLDGDPEEVHVLSSPSAAGHTLALRGLLPESSYDCVLSADDGAAGLDEPVIVETSALPEGFPETHIAVTDGERRGYTLLYHSSGRATESKDRLFILDDEARIRWYYDSVTGDPKDLDVQYIGDDRILYGGGYETPPTLIDLSHQLISVGPPPSTGLYHHHHAEWLPGGNILSLAAATNSSGLVDWTGFIVEIRDAESGALSWSWDSQRGVDDGLLHSPVAGENGDEYHANWVGVIGDDAYVGLRQIHQLLRIDRETGDILWRLGTNGDFQLLTDAGLPAPEEQWFYGAHGPDLNGDRILLYDNGWSRPGADSYSRVIELAVDEEARTAQIVWEFERDGWYEPIWGDVDYHGDDRVIVTRGHCETCSESEGPSDILEVDRETREAVWELVFGSPDDAIYRSERIDGCTLFSNQKYCAK